MGQLEQLLEGGSAARWTTPTQPGDVAPRSAHSERRLRSARPPSEDERLLRAFAERYFPDAAGPTLMLKTCLFTNSPDEHFILDRHPHDPEVMLAAGFSGHGYKFCSVVGEIMADLAEKGETRHDIGFLHHVCTGRHAHSGRDTYSRHHRTVGQ